MSIGDKPMTEQEKIERRKKIIKQLNKFGFEDTINCGVEVNDVVNWHLAEIDRIVEPLVTHKKLWCGNWLEYTASYSIDETLNRAKGQQHDQPT